MLETELLKTVKDVSAILEKVKTDLLEMQSTQYLQKDLIEQNKKLINSNIELSKRLREYEKHLLLFENEVVKRDNYIQELENTIVTYKRNLRHW